MNKHGQNVIEYVCFLCVFIAAIVVMSVYIKRSVQGNWHTNTASVYPELYESGLTQEIKPLQIRSSNYNLQMPGFTKRGASWVRDGNGWKVWSK